MSDDVVERNVSSYLLDEKYDEGLGNLFDEDEVKEESANATNNMRRRGRRPGSSNRRKVVKESDIPVKIISLGGANEIGKNMMVIEYENDAIIIDCGMTFPDDEMLGVDLVIPDMSYLETIVDKLRGVVITHGHEDHIGGLPYLIKKYSLPIYATKLTHGLIENKFKEHSMDVDSLCHVVKASDVIKLGGFTVEFIHVNHSIPDAVGLAIRCGAGTIVHTGDFKIDFTPIEGGMIDLTRFSELGKEGVLVLMSDSTNAERAGFAVSERNVGSSFERLFESAQNRRIIIASFASNIHRLQQIFNMAQKFGRKVALSGRSMLNVVSIAKEKGYINFSDDILVDISSINRYPQEKIVLVTTGSQGEPMSALHRIAFSNHKQVEVDANDFIIISATPIPGNEKLVTRVINELMKLGAEVIYEAMYDTHVSGHACQEELKLMLSLVKPKYFLPVHGEFKHLKKHAMLAKDIGIPVNNIMLLDIGKVIEVSQQGIKATGVVRSGRLLVDGLGVGDVGSVVLRDRKHLAKDGLIIVVTTLSKQNSDILAGPDIVSRGFVYVRDSEVLLQEAKELAMAVFDECFENNIREWGHIKSRLREELSDFLYQKTKRNPMVLPIIMEV